MDIAEQISNMAINHRQGTPVFVHGSSEHQYFDFPKFIMDYILEDPKSFKLWKKLIQTCKWFFDKNPIVVISCLHYNDVDEGCRTCSTANCRDLRDRLIALTDTLPFKLWITERLDIHQKNTAAVGLISHIFKCDFKIIKLFEQKLSFGEFLFFAPKITCLEVASWLRDSDGKIVPFEKIVESLPKLHNLT
uniref:Uncharacterized protein n=1 Tax=Panagrolaimus sp. ES5 TaxID=591445 RepID=A0AC34F7M7_9BILA